VDARQALDSERLNSEVRHRSNEHLFKVANVAVYIFTVRAEVDDRIADNLAQTVVSDLPAPIGLEQSNSSRGESVFRNQHRRLVATSPDRKGVWVLQ
jgi:hypothetical protein